MSTNKFDERITTRYGEPDKRVHQKVMDIVEEYKLPKSTAQLVLMKLGLEYLDKIDTGQIER